MFIVVATKQIQCGSVDGFDAGFNLHKSDKNRITGGENVASETMSGVVFCVCPVFGWF